MPGEDNEPLEHQENVNKIKGSQARNVMMQKLMRRSEVCTLNKLIGWDGHLEAYKSFSLHTQCCYFLQASHWLCGYTACSCIVLHFRITLYHTCIILLITSSLLHRSSTEELCMPMCQINPDFICLIVKVCFSKCGIFLAIFIEAGSLRL